MSMRSKFPGHFRLVEQEIKKVWNTSLIVLDANVLLNFYRYSDRTRRDFLGLLQKIRQRLWLPHQACKEFLTNRLTTIAEQEREYGEAVLDLQRLQAKFKNDRKHPFLPAALENRAEKVFVSLESHLNREKERFGALTSQDPILGEIEELFNERIGEHPTDEALAAIYKSGAERYKKRVPPGFKDSAKPDEAGDEKKFGDLVLWMEMLGKAKAEKTAMIFVTDDRKEDWWLMSGSKTIGPRPELFAEFVAQTSQQILFYQPHRFLEYAKPFLGEEVPPAAIAETKARKDATPATNAEVLSGPAWFERMTELDRRVVNLRREMVAAEHDLNQLRGVFDIIGDEKLAAQVHLAELDVSQKRQALAHAQAELKAIMASQ